MKTTVIHHSADYDGIFCREIAKKFLPGAEFIGWDFPDKQLPIPDGQIYIMDLPVDRVFGFDFHNMGASKDSTLDGHTSISQPGSIIREFLVSVKRVIWIDHHKSSIDTHPSDIPGYRIDGVSACRLAWQWFSTIEQHKDEDLAENWKSLPTDVQFKNREVSEPLAVTLAGEYDVWDHTSSDGDDIKFQFGLDAQHRIEWNWILQEGDDNLPHIRGILDDGKAAMACYAKRDANVMRSRSFKVQWEGLTFLTLNTARCNSNTFNALDVPETGHDALMAFAYDGKQYNFSLYHAAHNKGIDLSVIAKKHGGGGHRGACGFRMDKLPFIQ